jgi:hypothetical protein
MSKKLLALIGVVVVVLALIGTGIGLYVTRSVSGTQTIVGHTTNVTAKGLPVTASGVVTSTSGSLPLNGPNNSGKSVIKFNNGTLDVTHSKGDNHGQGRVTFDKASCSFTDVITGTYMVTGGSGSYAGATGSGTYKVAYEGKFAETMGQCVISQNSNPVSGAQTFIATGPLTVNG